MSGTTELWMARQMAHEREMALARRRLLNEIKAARPKAQARSGPLIRWWHQLHRPTPSMRRSANAG
ncbi:MAG: hypothetical protein WBX27_03015 [Specibacter sp.]